MRFMMPSVFAYTRSQPGRMACARQFSPSPVEAFVADDAIRCDACPVLCYIKPGRAGSCDRYGNHDGKLVRLDPHVMLDRTVERGDSLVPLLERGPDWDGTLVRAGETFVTAIGAGTTYPDYKPAPFIISSHLQGADRVTRVTEVVCSHCVGKLKSHTQPHRGAVCGTAA